MTAPSGPQPYPWRVEDLLRWYALLGTSLVALAVAWWGVSGTVDLGRAITWLDVSVLALVAAGLANSRWLLQGRRAVAARCRDELPDPAELGQRPALSTPSQGELRVAVLGMTRHHRRGCPAVAGKTVREMSVGEHERAGRGACGLCLT